jgi:hypothetical protein
MFGLYLVLLVAAMLQLGGVLFDHSVLSAPLPSTLAMIALIANLLSILILLAIAVSMPLAVPSDRIDPKDIVSQPLSLVYFAKSHSLSFRAILFLRKTTPRFGGGSRSAGSTRSSNA